LQLFPFSHATFRATSIKYFAKRRSLIKKHALELFQYSSVFFDNRIELNSDLKAIVEMTLSNISPQLHAKLFNCQETLCTVELAKCTVEWTLCIVELAKTSCTSFLANCQATSCTSFSMLRKLSVKDRQYLAL